MTLYEWVQQQFREAYTFIDTEFDDTLLEHIMWPDRVIEVHLPVTMDDGTVRTFTGYRSQHTDVKWPYKWWIRYHQNVSKDEVMSLSAWMSIKTSAIWLPLGWGKGWIIVNPKELSDGEKERLSRAYGAAIAKFIGPETDVPAPDVNTTPQIMWWIADEYAKVTGKRTPGVITWKPLTIGWSKWRWVATALWAFYVLNGYLADRWEKLAGKTVAVQWAWNAWLHFARFAVDAWATIVAISDSKWWIHNATGLDITQIEEIKAWRWTVTSYADGEQLDSGELLELDVDILVPAALENAITSENASDIKALIVLEIANGPVTNEADEMLENKDITVIPDVLANAWWVTVSYFEQVQNNANFYWSEAEVFDRLKTLMDDATTDIIAIAKEKKTTLRNSAYINSLRRILSAMRDRGM